MSFNLLHPIIVLVMATTVANIIQWFRGRLVRGHWYSLVWASMMGLVISVSNIHIVWLFVGFFVAAAINSLLQGWLFSLYVQDSEDPEVEKDKVRGEFWAYWFQTFPILFGTYLVLLLLFPPL